MQLISCRVEQQPARHAHNVKVVGANPTPASIFCQRPHRTFDLRRLWGTVSGAGASYAMRPA